MRNTSAKIDRAAILRSAWRSAKANARDASFAGHIVSPRSLIGREMKMAWQDAKEATAKAAHPEIAMRHIRRALASVDRDHATALYADISNGGDTFAATTGE